MKTFIFLMGLISVLGLSFSLQNVTSCGILNVSDTYVLTTDLVGSPTPGTSSQTSFTCLKITAPNTVLDCDGFNITENFTGSDVRSGIEASGPLNNSNITIMNCEVSGYDYDIALWSTNNSVVTNNTVSNSTFAGIYLSFSGNIATAGSSFNNVTNNTAANNGGYGIATFLLSDNNLFEGNVAYGSGNDGLRNEISNNNVIRNNIFHDNNDGTISFGGTNNTIINNLVYNHPRSGIEVGDDDNQVINNTVINSSRGLFFISASNLLVANNTATSNDVDGFDIDGPVNSTFEWNIANNNGRGFFIRADSNLFTNNTANNNTFGGMELQGAEGNALIDNFVQENGFFDLTVVPYDLPDDCNNLVVNMTGSGGRPIDYTNESVVISGGTFSELVLCNADGSSISGVVIDGSDTLGNNALWLESSDNVSITNVSSNDNYYGFLLASSPGAVLSGVSASGNTEAGVAEFTSVGPASTIIGSSLSGNGWAIVQNSFNSVPFTVNGTLVGNVNISMSDEIGSGGGGFSVNESDAPASNPPGFAPFGDKYIKILFTGDLGINSTTFHWSDSELAGVDEPSINLFTWNNTGWVSTPSQTTDAATNSLTVLGLINITEDDIYGLFYAPEDSDGGGTGPGTEPEPENTTIIECVTDDDCAVNEVCTAGLCADISCACGEAVAHQCVAYECCSDSDCGTGESCSGNFCRQSQPEQAYECGSDQQCPASEYCAIPAGQDGGDCTPVQPGACGEVKDHVFVPYGYECGTEPGCPSCPQGQACVAHECAQAPDISCPSTGIVGEQKTCTSAACENCDVEVILPDGKKIAGKTDESGNFDLPLDLEGVYKVLLLKDGVTQKTVEVKALPRSVPGDEGKPSAAGGFDAGSLMWLVLIVLVIGGLLIYLRSRSGQRR